MENKPKNYGFIVPIIKEEDFHFGAGQIVGQVLQESGQWDDFLPQPEDQNKNGIDVDGCTAFGTTNAYEILFRRKFGEYDFSDRGLYIEAKIRPPGADPNYVIDTFRKKASPKESSLPFDSSIDTLEKYWSPDPLPKNLVDEANQFLKGYVIGHDWVASGTVVSPEVIKTALKFSPLCVGVYAWALDGDKYVRMGDDCHWTVIYGYEDGQYWKVWDSYDPNIKYLAWDFGFKYVKRIHLDINTVPEQISIIQQIINLYWKIISILKGNA